MEMQEKVMVADTLAGINGELVRFAEMIPQTENKELKTVFLLLDIRHKPTKDDIMMYDFLINWDMPLLKE